MKKEIFSKAYLISTILLIFSLPFYLNITLYAYTIWIISGLLVLITSKSFVVSRLAAGILIASLLFVLSQFISALMSENQAQGMKQVYLLNSLIFVPIIIIIGAKIIHTNKNLLLKVFIGGYILSTVIQIGFALIQRYFQGSEIGYYGEFSLFQHPTYASLGANAAISILLYLLKGIKSSNRQRIYIVLAIIVLSFGVYMHSSRISLISLFFVYLFWIFSVLFNRKYNLKYRLLLPLAIAIPSIIVVQNERFNANMYEITDFLEKKSDSSGTRVSLWNSAYEIGSNNILFGCGNGDVVPEIYKIYKNPKHLNAHNQFLEVYAGGGLISLIPFTIFLILSFISVIKENKLLGYSLYFLFIITMIVESVLLRSIGVILFSIIFYFFSNLLFQNKKIN